jgi:hypothetical protein
MKATKRCLLAAVLILGLGINPVLAAPSAPTKPPPPPAPGPVAITTCQTTITQSGSYVLTGNLTDTGNPSSCILLQASNVTIDLAGFTITGPGGGGDIFGISDGGPAAPPLHGIEIRNGVIQGFNLAVDLKTSTNVIVEDMRVSDSVGGIYVGQGLVRDNVVQVTAADGIFVGVAINSSPGLPGSIASGNTVVATQAAQQGIAETCPSLLIGNIVTGPFQGPNGGDPACVFINNAPPP